MSEQKQRTSEDIVKEFNNLAFRAGNIQYEVSEKTKELSMLNETLRSLTLEFNKVKAAEQAEAAAKAAEAAKPAEEAPAPKAKKGSK